jgi:hypothetical protein
MVFPSLLCGRRFPCTATAQCAHRYLRFGTRLFDLRWDFLPWDGLVLGPSGGDALHFLLGPLLAQEVDMKCWQFVDLAAPY